MHASLHFSSKSARLRRRGFTMVELLVVLAVGLILATLSAMALRSLTGSSNLDAASAEVGGALAFARQTAMSHNSIAAFVLITDTTTYPKAAYRTYSVWECTQTSQSSGSPWVQVSRWQPLPQGIVVDNGSKAAGQLAWLTGTNVSIYPNLTGLTYQGQSLGSSNFTFIPFMPSGRIGGSVSGDSSATPFILTLVPGVYDPSSTKLVYTSPTSTSGGTTSTKSANYVQYIFSIATGAAKQIRP